MKQLNYPVACGMCVVHVVQLLVASFNRRVRSNHIRTIAAHVEAKPRTMNVSRYIADQDYDKTGFLTESSKRRIADGK